MRRLALLAVGLLVAVNGALLVAVAQTDRSASPQDQADRIASGAQEPDDATAFGEDATVAVALADDGAVFQLWRGSCSSAGSARLDVSTDGGATFDEAALPVEAEADGDAVSILRTVLAVQAESAEELTVVGNDADCEARAYETTDGGQEWSEQDSFDGWFVAASPREVRGPQGTSMPGCDSLRVDPLSEDNAKVLCADGVVRGTNDAGGEWAFLGSLPGAVDIAFADIGSGLALVSGQECATRALATGDAGGQWEPVGCVSESEPPRSLAVRGETVYALVGSELRVSPDGGATWSTPADDDDQDDEDDQVAE